MVDAGEIRSYCSHLPNLGPEVLGTTAAIVEEIYRAWRRRNRVWTIGNGGSALTASHFALDLAKGTTFGASDIPGVRALSLMDRLGPLTAWSNDRLYILALREQIKIHADHGDCVIGFSCSGMSKNVLEAFEVAAQLGALTFLFTGPNEDSHARRHAWLTVGVDLPDIRQVEDVHQALAHAIAGAVRGMIWDSAKASGFQMSGDAREIWSLI